MSLTKGGRGRQDPETAFSKDPVKKRHSIAFVLIFFRPGSNGLSCLRAGLLLLLLPQGHETDTGDLDDLETDTGNITLGLALTTETGQEDLVVLVDEVQATVVGDYNQLLVYTLSCADILIISAYQLQPKKQKVYGTHRKQ